MEGSGIVGVFREGGQRFGILGDAYIESAFHFVEMTFLR
jgi:hypothetical protein